MNNTIEHINCVFADSAHASYTGKRYGIKSCNKKVDENYAFDLKFIYERMLEIDCCGLTTNSKYTLINVEEKINTI